MSPTERDSRPRAAAWHSKSPPPPLCFAAGPCLYRVCAVRMQFVPRSDGRAVGRLLVSRLRKDAEKTPIGRVSASLNAAKVWIAERSPSMLRHWRYTLCLLGGVPVCSSARGPRGSSLWYCSLAGKGPSVGNLAVSCLIFRLVPTAVLWPPRLLLLSLLLILERHLSQLPALQVPSIQPTLAETTAFFRQRLELYRRVSAATAAGEACEELHKQVAAPGADDMALVEVARADLAALVAPVTAALEGGLSATVAASLAEPETVVVLWEQLLAAAAAAAAAPPPPLMLWLGVSGAHLVAQLVCAHRQLCYIHEVALPSASYMLHQYSTCCPNWNSSYLTVATSPFVCPSRPGSPLPSHRTGPQLRAALQPLPWLLGGLTRSAPAPATASPHSVAGWAHRRPVFGCGCSLGCCVRLGRQQWWEQHALLLYGQHHTVVMLALEVMGRCHRYLWSLPVLHRTPLLTTWQPRRAVLYLDVVHLNAAAAAATSAVVTPRSLDAAAHAAPPLSPDMAALPHLPAVIELLGWTLRYAEEFYNIHFATRAAAAAIVAAGDTAVKVALSPTPSEVLPGAPSAAPSAAPLVVNASRESASGSNVPNRRRSASVPVAAADDTVSSQPALVPPPPPASAAVLALDPLAVLSEAKLAARMAEEADVAIVVGGRLAEAGSLVKWLSQSGMLVLAAADLQQPAAGVITTTGGSGDGGDDAGARGLACTLVSLLATHHMQAATVRTLTQPSGQGGGAGGVQSKARPCDSAITCSTTLHSTSRNSIRSRSHCSSVIAGGECRRAAAAGCADIPARYGTHQACPGRACGDLTHRVGLTLQALQAAFAAAPPLAPHAAMLARHVSHQHVAQQRLLLEGLLLAPELHRTRHPATRDGAAAGVAVWPPPCPLQQQRRQQGPAACCGSHGVVSAVWQWRHHC
ncbi:hypothetical protein VOLCADRAFT_99411 [Volvox carteri f. nagariensis]|uniref:Uncharacterized protein n=1 Tax=Volvox carteri f. nagariensis TaxID=3068 RepID=D8UHQ8_VOLCA|nr:uncharacterized protein VOLCADRAFT_99411 [Volvox carteri f. nagariensis]EFJ40721.1 hypothetical protein VOLCADRAFT_99411 [Volvox carteri f. nagariensis]|eukprot:XP_002958187.1 hypothetical protein VOLCADRAFT_99411 [Volvox carteri f. nagariensis]